MARAQREIKQESTLNPTAVYVLELMMENVGPFLNGTALSLVNSDGSPELFTLLLGENNVGKSTLLRALTLVVDLRPRSYRMNGTFERATQSLWRDGNEAPLRISAKLGAFSLSATELIKSGEYTLSIGNDNIEETYGPFVLGRTSARCVAYGIHRRPALSPSAAFDLADGTASMFTDEAALRDPSAWLLQADYNAKLSSPAIGLYERHRDRVRSLLIEALPDVDDLRIVPPAEPIARWPIVEAKTSGHWISIRRLGAGYQAQLAWMTDFASRMLDWYPDSDNPLAEPAICLIDEIDLHMHPKWQRQIVDLLRERFPQTQFIATAHSPLIVQAAEDANLVLLRREGDHVVIDNDPERLKSWRVDQILTSELFGLESAFPPEIDKLVAERRTLLAKTRRTKTDQRRLSTIEAEIGRLPAGESDLELRAMDLIRRAAGKLPSDA